jgi:hypothetical protein
MAIKEGRGMVIDKDGDAGMVFKMAKKSAQKPPAAWSRIRARLQSLRTNPHLVSGHDFSRAEKAQNPWALAPAA